MIRLEIGALAAWTPVETKRIRSYVSEVYESAFSQPATDILTTSAERSFWEKLTILHREVYRAGTNRCLHVIPGIIMIYIVMRNRNIKKVHFDNLIY